MKEKNDYGMYSGAFIFDVLDRHALKYIKDQAHLPKKAVLVTRQASVSFKRQLCQKKYVVLSHSYNEVQLYTTLYFCTVDICLNCIIVSCFSAVVEVVCRVIHAEFLEQSAVLVELGRSGVRGICLGSAW